MEKSENTGKLKKILEDILLKWCILLSFFKNLWSSNFYLTLFWNNTNIISLIINNGWENIYNNLITINNLKKQNGKKKLNYILWY